MQIHQQIAYMRQTLLEYLETHLDANIPVNEITQKHIAQLTVDFFNTLHKGETHGNKPEYEVVNVVYDSYEVIPKNLYSFVISLGLERPTTLLPIMGEYEGDCGTYRFTNEPTGGVHTFGRPTGSYKPKVAVKCLEVVVTLSRPDNSRQEWDANVPCRKCHVHIAKGGGCSDTDCPYKNQ